METIMYEDLYFDDYEKYQCGSFGKVRKCYYNSKRYAYKEFNYDDYLNGKKRKLMLLSKVDNPKLFVPKFWVKKKYDENKTYLTDFSMGKDIEFLISEDYLYKLKILRDTKNLIIQMHNEGIIHSDLIPSNIMYNNSGASIIDFDNCSYKGFKTNIDDTNDYSYEFLKKYGLRKEVDIHMFNLLTYYLINESKDYYLLREQIYLKNYGYFNNKDGIKICKSLFLDDKVPNKDFLIDTIDETNYSI